MAMMIECRAIVPGGKGKTEKHCSERNPSGNKTCRSCGRSLKRGGGVYWIDWRDHGKRRRERIGPSKEAAELRLGEIRRAIVEERHINRDKGARITLGELVGWYLALPEVDAKKSWRRDVQMLGAVTRLSLIHI